MLRFIVGVFLVLHGLVHLLYFGQSWRLFELQPGMTWPQGSWAFARLLNGGGVNMLASISLVLAAVAFLAGGVAILTQQAWWSPVVVFSAVFSIVIFLLFWDGQFQHLDSKGAVGILIDLAVLAAALLLKQTVFAK